MKTPAEVHAILQKNFPDRIVRCELGALDPWMVIAPESILAICSFLKEAPELAFDSLMCLSGVDYKGAKGETDRLEVVYHLFSMQWRHKIVLKIVLNRDNPVVHSLESVWAIANWHEREAFDMYGIRFEGHSDLRRILCPDDWEGYPLRKDYVQPQTYLGMPVAPTVPFAELAQKGELIGTDPVTGKPLREMNQN
jgi:NADH-quinone oxidoreductase subunit C